MSLSPSQRLAALALALAALTVIAPVPTSADAYVQGPLDWTYQDSTRRYRRHAGNHHVSITHCGTQSHLVELRVDVVNKKDKGYGIRTYRCGASAKTIASNYDTYGSDYRGHFLQVQEGFDGTLKDT